MSWTSRTGAGQLALLAVAAASATIGCESPTEIVVSIDSDLAVPAELDRIEIVVTTLASPAQRTSVGLASVTELPVTLGIVTSSDPSPEVVVRVEGSLGGRPVVAQSARARMEKGRILRLDIPLLRGCGGIVCVEGRTCDENGCRLEEIPDGALPEWDGPPARRSDFGALPIDATAELAERMCADTSKYNELESFQFRGAACVPATRQVLLQGVGVYATDALERGDLFIRAELIEACADATVPIYPGVASPTPRLLDGEVAPRVCAELVEGVVALGAACSRPADCAGDAYCAIGVCTPRRANGEPCATAEECSGSPTEPYVACLADGSGTRACGAARVALGATIGAPCDTTPMDGGVFIVEECGPGLICDRVDDECIEPLRDGAGCVYGASLCGPSSVCDALASPVVCTGVELLETAGASCAERIPAPSCSLLYGLTCGPSDICTCARESCATPVPAVGEPCIGVCPVGSTCNPSTFTCVLD